MTSINLDAKLFFELLTTTFETILIFGFFNSHLGHKYKSIVYMFVPMVCIAILWANDHVELFLSYKAIIAIFMYIIVAQVFYQGKILNKILLSFLIIALLAFTDMITLSIENLVRLAITNLDDISIRYLMLLISKTIFLILVRLCSKKTFIAYKDIKISIAYWSLLFAVPLITVTIFLVIFFSLQFVPASYHLYGFVLLSSAGLLFFNLLIFYTFGMALKSTQIQHDHELMEQQHKLQIKHFENLEAKQQELRAIKHDMKNHIFCIQTLLDKNKISDAKEYIRQTNTQLDQTNTYANSGNSIVDAIINDKCSIADSKGIKVKAKVNILPDSNIANYDLCIVLSNIIDNAIEACGRMGDEPKFIDISVEHKKEFLFILVKNSFTEQPIVKDGLLVTGKTEEREFHGIGLSNVKSIVGKYNGYVNTDFKDRIFEVEIFMCDRESSNIA